MYLKVTHLDIKYERITMLSLALKFEFCSSLRHDHSFHSSPDGTLTTLDPQKIGQRRSGFDFAVVNGKEGNIGALVLPGQTVDGLESFGLFGRNFHEINLCFNWLYSRRTRSLTTTASSQPKFYDFEESLNEAERAEWMVSLEVNDGECESISTCLGNIGGRRMEEHLAPQGNLNMENSPSREDDQVSSCPIGRTSVLVVPGKEDCKDRWTLTTSVPAADQPEVEKDGFRRLHCREVMNETKPVSLQVDDKKEMLGYQWLAGTNGGVVLKIHRDVVVPSARTDGSRDRGSASKDERMLESSCKLSRYRSFLPGIFRHFSGTAEKGAGQPQAGALFVAKTSFFTGVAAAVEFCLRLLLRGMYEQTQLCDVKKEASLSS
uniref:Uncharacterized protein n=1 Tax=Setaria digitata TaxID=48799 RepID=A0A915PK03_9BILA